MSEYRVMVPGEPATFATKREAAWKEIMTSSISSSISCDGLEMMFILPTLKPKGHPLDLDNLCEPVFSVLTGRLGWFGGRKTNIKWWRASKYKGENAGLLLSTKSDNHVMTENIVFDAIYSGLLPKKATDPEISNWIKDIYDDIPTRKERYSLRLQFGGTRINIGDIATGKVKALIDCLYLLIGGTAGNPEDWRIDKIFVEKEVPGLTDGMIRITLMELCS